MQKVVYYARVSTEEEQQAAALVTQCMENEEHINNREDWILVDRYVDEGKSGTTMEGRSEFNRMISDMETNKFDIILIKQIDRGWRNLGDWKIFENILVKSGVKLFIRLRNDFYDIRDDGSYISTTMDSMFAEWYSRNLSKKLNAAHQTRMKKGTVVTSGTMWGYNQVNASLEINEEEAEIVRFVYESYIQGKGFRTIAADLYKKGITNRAGGQFSLTTLKRIIKNEKYKGTLICGKTHRNFFTKKIEPVPKEQWIVHEDKIPAIVSKDTWAKANEVLNNKKKKYNMDKVVGYFTGSYPLSSKIVCSKCGKKYYHNVYSVPKGRYGVWQCATYSEKGKADGCDNIIVRESELDYVVKEVMFEMWTEKDKQIANVIKALEETIEDTNNDAELDKIKKAITKLQQKKEKLFELYTEEIISKEEFKEKNNRINEKIKERTVQYEALKKDSITNGTKEIRMKKIREFLNQDLKNVKSVTDTMMRELVSEIVVYPDRKLDITLNGNPYENVSDTRPNRFGNRSGRSSI